MDVGVESLKQLYGTFPTSSGTPGVHERRRRTKPKPPDTIPNTPRTMSQMLLSLGAPLTASVTEDDSEFDALSPYTSRMTPMMRKAMEGIFGMMMKGRG